MHFSNINKKFFTEFGFYISEFNKKNIIEQINEIMTVIYNKIGINEENEGDEGNITNIYNNNYFV